MKIIEIKWLNVGRTEHGTPTGVCMIHKPVLNLLQLSDVCLGIALFQCQHQLSGQAKNKILMCLIERNKPTQEAHSFRIWVSPPSAEFQLVRQQPNVSTCHSFGWVDDPNWATWIQGISVAQMWYLDDLDSESSSIWWILQYLINLENLEVVVEFPSHLPEWRHFDVTTMHPGGYHRFLVYGRVKTKPKSINQLAPLLTQLTFFEQHPSVLKNSPSNTLAETVIQRSLYLQKCWIHNSPPSIITILEIRLMALKHFKNAHHPHPLSTNLSLGKAKAKQTDQVGIPHWVSTPRECCESPARPQNRWSEVTYSMEIVLHFI